MLETTRNYPSISIGVDQEVDAGKRGSEASLDCIDRDCIDREQVPKQYVVFS